MSNKSFFKNWGDIGIWIIVAIFAMISVVAVFSSSSFLARGADVTRVNFLIEQLQSVALGFISLFVLYLIPMKVYRSFSFLAYFLAVALIICGLIFGETINGANRGISIGGRTIQVLEPAKIAIVLYLARAIEHFKIDNFWKYLLYLILPVAVLCLLVIVSSFSSALIIAVLSLLTLIIAGINWKYILATIGIGVAAFLMLFFIYTQISPSTHITSDGIEVVAEQDSKKEQSLFYKVFNRFGVIVDRFSQHSITSESVDISEKSEAELDEIRQSENAKIAIREGGLLGKGPGNSTQRYHLSLAFSDFIFAFIIEEYGLFFATFIMLLYLAFLARTINIGMECTTKYASLVSIGLGMLITIQALIHILVNVRVIPITGQTLPLISHGGTAYVFLSGAVGIILSISRNVNQRKRVEPEKKSVENEKV